MRATRTLYISDSTTVSGAEIVMLAHIDHFGPPAWEPHVFLHGRNHRLKKELDRRGCAYTASHAYSRIVLETTANPRSLLHFARSFYRVGKEIRRLIRGQQIDRLHAVSYPASLYAAVAARRLHVPVIWHEHNIKRLHAFNRRLFRFVASACAWTIGPSRAVTRTFELAGISSSKIRTVYNGVDLARFVIDDRRAGEVRVELGLGPADRAVALPGQMLPFKGHRLLIDLAPVILARIPTTRFFFVGALENPPYEEELRAAVRKAGLDGRFHFTGWRQDMPDVLRAMDVIVVATTRPEPAALTLMESMAMGRPIVASRSGGTPEIVVDGESGLLYETADEAGAATQILRCLESRSLCERLGFAGRDRVERLFTLEGHLAEIERLYASAAGPVRE